MLFSIDEEFEEDFDDSFDDDLDENFDDSFGDDESVSEGQPQKKKKSPLFTILIILICALGGGFALMKAGIISPKPTTAPAQVAEVIEHQAEPEQEQEMVEADTDSAFIEEEPIEQEEASSSDDFDIFGEEEEVVEEASDDLFADHSMTEESDTNMGDIFATEEVETEQVEESQAEELVFDVQEEQADDVQPAEAQVQEMSFDEPVVTTMQEVETAPSQEVLSRLEAIEDKVSGLENAPAKQTEQEYDAAVLDDFRSEIASLKAEIASLKAEKKKAPKEASIAPKQTAPKKASVETVEVKAEKLSMWMIKSAQPGKALLSSNGKGVLSVKVGDVLSGVGTIKFIGINDQDLWEVRGSLASVLEPK